MLCSWLQVKNGNSTALLVLLSTLTLFICCLNLFINSRNLLIQDTVFQGKTFQSTPFMGSGATGFGWDATAGTRLNTRNGLRLQHLQCKASHSHELFIPTVEQKEVLTTMKMPFLDVPILESIGGEEAGSVAGDLVRKLSYTLGKIEREMNKGWNTTQEPSASGSSQGSQIKVLPLGDYDYVRRDLPVYKGGFDALEAQSRPRASSALVVTEVLKRPKGGMLLIPTPSGVTFETEEKRDVEMDKFLVSSEYSALLCLSFNTDHCINDENFRFIPRSKKINRIKYLRDVLWSKDKFCRTANAATRGLKQLIRENKGKYHLRHSWKDFQFTFPCWIMPTEYKALLSYARNREKIDGEEAKFIAKPRSLGAGKGIYLVNDYEELLREKKTSNLLQTYLSAPHLIYKETKDGRSRAGYKWDLRTYVLVTSVTPLRAYVYDRGLVRIATSPYDRANKCAGENKTSCLTNTSINKKTEGALLKDITWSLHKLRKYLGGVDFDIMFQKMQKVIGLALLSAETAFRKKYGKDNADFSQQNPSVKGSFWCENCYQLLGVDILFDEDLSPMVVEVNGEPSLKTTTNGRSHYDITKKSMAKDLVKVVYNTQSLIEDFDLPNKLLKWAKCVGLDPGFQKAMIGEERDLTPFLGKDTLEYLLQSVRERQALGGFKPIYPPEPSQVENAHVFEEFLTLQMLREQTKGIQEGAHYDGRRLGLHQFMQNMLTSDELEPTLRLGNEDDIGLNDGEFEIA